MQKFSHLTPVQADSPPVRSVLWLTFYQFRGILISGQCKASRMRLRLLKFIRLSMESDRDLFFYMGCHTSLEREEDAWRRACRVAGRFLNQFNFWFFQNIYHNHKNNEVSGNTVCVVWFGAGFLPTTMRLPVQGRVVPKYVENEESGTTTQESKKKMSSPTPIGDPMPSPPLKNPKRKRRVLKHG